MWSGREHEYEKTTDERFSFVVCGECGLARLNPRPDVGELGRIYPPDYYAYNLVSEDSGESPKLTDRAKRWLYRRRVVRQIERLDKPEATIRVLDVGCADGRLLDWYKGSPVGERLETHGIEMDEGAAEIARARGHRVVTARFELDTELEPARFDLILAAHVIEHVPDPKAFARRAAELLAPGGLFVVATPNRDSRDARRLRGHWGGNHFPRHWTLYDERSARDLAARVGLELERIDYQPNPIFRVWSAHSRLCDRFPASAWPDRLFPPVAIFEPGPRSFALLSGYTALDLAQRALTGKTASMSVELRKPPIRGG